MDYIQTLLKAKRLDVDSILKSECRITLKEDGCAFQTMYDPGCGQLIFGKRSRDPKRITKPLTPFDIFTNGTYYTSVKRLEPFKDVIKEYDILNFEVLSPYEQHIVPNENADVELVLLSAYKDGVNLEQSALKPITARLHVSSVKELYRGGLPQSIISSIRNNPEEPFTYKQFCDFLGDYCREGMVSPYGIEGFVIEFRQMGSARRYKIINPDFHSKMASALMEQRASKVTSFEPLYRAVMNAALAVALPENWDEIPYIKKVCWLYNEICSPALVEMSQKIDMQHNTLLPLQWEYLGIQPDKRTQIDNDNRLLRFMLNGFRNKRLKNPLWCSVDFQLREINPFIETIERHAA